MVEVQKCTTSTLLPIIQQYVRPGTTVLSDEWRGIPSLGMTHQTVNHSLNFVDPNTRVHTQRIEKYMIHREGVMNTSRSFHTYLPEFLWRKKFSNSDPFSTIIDHIKELFEL